MFGGKIRCLISNGPDNKETLPNAMKHVGMQKGANFTIV